MTNKLASVLCALAFLILSVPALAADYNDKIEIDLKVKGSNDPTWENNLETSKVVLGPNVKFDVQMIIKNKDSYNQTWIKVKTFLPAVLVANSDMSFTIPDLGAGSEISKIFTVTLKDKSLLPQMLPSLKSQPLPKLNPVLSAKIGPISTPVAASNPLPLPVKLSRLQVYH